MKLSISSFAYDSFFKVLKLGLKIEDESKDVRLQGEDFLFFKDYDEGKKLKAEEMEAWVSLCKLDAVEMSFACDTITEDAPHAAVANSEKVEVVPAPAANAVLPGCVVAEVVAPAPVSPTAPTAPTAPAAPAAIAALAAKPIATRVRAAKKVDVIDVLDDPVPVAAPAPAKVHVDVTFIRSDKTHLVQIVDAIQAVNTEWKANPPLVAAIRDALNACNGLWIYTRDGVVNSALVDAVFTYATTLGKTALPTPSFKG